MRRRQDENAAVEAIQKLGGRVYRDEAADGKPIDHVNLGATKATDADLEPIKAFPKLKKLMLNSTAIGDAALDVVAATPTVEKLYLVDTKITDAGLEKLKGLAGLQVLSLVGTPVTDAGLEHLAAYPALKLVFLDGTQVTDEGVKTLQEAKPDLKIERASPPAEPKAEAPTPSTPEEKKDDR
jgi:hypothetical protein